MDHPSRVAQVLEHDGLAPMLPLLYSAWIDGELTADELTALESELVSLDRLNSGERQAIAAWLEPDAPPTAAEVAALERHIRRAAPDVLIERRPSELGLRLAGSIDDAVAQLLGKAEAAAGGFTADVSRRLTHDTTRSSNTLSPLPDPGPAPDSYRALADALDAPHGAVRARVRQILSRPAFAAPVEIDSDAYRELVLGWTRILADEGIGALGFPESLGGSNDPGGFIAAFAEIADTM